MKALRPAMALLALFMLGATAEPLPELIVQRVHPMQRWTSATEAPLYATANDAGRIEFWDARTGTLMRAVTVPPAMPAPMTTAAPPSVVLSNDGRRAAFAADGRMALIATRDGTQRALPAKLNAFSRPLAFSPDGKALAVNIRSAPDPNTLQTLHDSIALVTVADGATVAIPGGETTAAYSPDGRYVATLTHDRDRLLLFDTHRRTPRSMSDGGGVYGPLAFSPDGSLIASLGDDPSIPPDGKGIFEPNATDHQMFVKLWDVRRGRRAALVPWQAVSARLTLDEQAPGAFAFGDRRTLGVAKTTQTVVYDTASRAVTKRLVHTKLDNFPFGNQAVTPYRVGGMLGFLDQNITEFGFMHWTGTALVTDATVPFPAMLGNAAIDPAGRTLGIDLRSYGKFGGSQRDGAYELELESLRWTAIPAHQQLPQPIEFLRDGRLAVPSPCGLIYVDVAKQKTVRPAVPAAICKGGSMGEPNFALSADGQTVFLGSISGTADLMAYDTATGQRRFSPALSTSLPVTCATDRAECLFTQRTTEPNFGNVHEPVTLAVLDSNTGRVISGLTIHAWNAGSAFIDSDRELLVREWTETNVDLYTMDVIDPLHGILKRQFPLADGNVTFAPSASRFAITAGNVTKIFDTHGALVNTVSDTSDNVRFFPDGSKLLVTQPDGTLAIRNATTGKLLVTLAFFPHAGGLEWLAYTPDDYFAGSPFGIDMIRWRIDAEIFAGAHFAERFHRPDRVAAAMR